MYSVYVKPSQFKCNGLLSRDQWSYYFLKQLEKQKEFA